ncbi:MAG: transposase [Rhodothermales bacterium]
MARIKSLLKIEGINIAKVADVDFSQLKSCIAEKLLPNLSSELCGEQALLQLVNEQLDTCEGRQRDNLARGTTRADEQAVKLQLLKAIGPVTSNTLAHEMFGWRTFANRRQVGGFTGLCGTPFNSGSCNRDQGISKEGNHRARRVLVEVAWIWLRYQPDSVITQWFESRFADGSARQRRVGIVGVARRLAIALWHYVEHDQLPQGAVLSK